MSEAKQVRPFNRFEQIEVVADITLFGGTQFTSRGYRLGEVISKHRDLDPIEAKGTLKNVLNWMGSNISDQYWIQFLNKQELGYLFDYCFNRYQQWLKKTTDSDDYDKFVAEMFRVNLSEQ